MELNTPRLTMPTKTLLQNAPYVPALMQDELGILTLWRWDRSSDNPRNYHEFQDTAPGYETDAAGRFTGEEQ